jgi:hypothetical protein
LLGLVACGHPKQAEDPHVVESAGLEQAEVTAPVLESVDTPITELERAKVVRTIDDGFGAFLARVEVEASLKGAASRASASCASLCPRIGAVWGCSSET